MELQHLVSEVRAPVLLRLPYSIAGLHAQPRIRVAGRSGGVGRVCVDAVTDYLMRSIASADHGIDRRYRRLDTLALSALNGESGERTIPARATPNIIVQLLQKRRMMMVWPDISGPPGHTFSASPRRAALGVRPDGDPVICRRPDTMRARLAEQSPVYRMP